jgi:hypothetical protein
MWPITGRLQPKFTAAYWYKGQFYHALNDYLNFASCTWQTLAKGTILPSVQQFAVFSFLVQLLFGVCVKTATSPG